MKQNIPKKRRICVACNSKLIKWGKTGKGRIRYRCPLCLTTKSSSPRKHRSDELHTLFQEFVLHGETVSNLSRHSTYSGNYLNLWFQDQIFQTPPHFSLPIPHREEQYVLLDGLWFGDDLNLMAYRLHHWPFIIHHSFGKRETATRVRRDLIGITQESYIPSGVVSDGGTGIVSGIKKAYGPLLHQICLLHMARQARSSIGKHPTDQRIVELKGLVDHLFLIESKEALKWYLGEIKSWSDRNKHFLTEYGHDELTHRWWYIHKGARHTLKVLLTTVKTSFAFLEDPLIPKTTNGIESIFSTVSSKWLVHRGLKHERWQPFLEWFIYYYNYEKLADSKFHWI
jgi:hypothetical protein